MRGQQFLIFQYLHCQTVCYNSAFIHYDHAQEQFFHQYPIIQINESKSASETSEALFDFKNLFPMAD